MLARLLARLFLTLLLLFLCASALGQAPEPPQDSEALPNEAVLANNVILSNSQVQIVISGAWGGAILSVQYKAGGSATAMNLVANAQGGVNLQTAFRHLNANWPTYDGTGLHSDQENWENQSKYNPTCASVDVITWNPTQASSSTSCGISNSFGHPDDQVPTLVTPNPPDLPHVDYRIRFTPWLPYDKLYNLQPSLKYRANVQEDAKVYLVTSHASDVGVFKHVATYKVLKEDKNGNPQSGYTEEVMAEDQVFYSTMTRAYAYDPSVANDCYGMSDITSTLCGHLAQCKDYGWRTGMGEDHWTPYVLLSTAPGSNQVWLLIYNTQDDPYHIQLRRRLIDSGAGPASVAPGIVVTPCTAFYSGNLTTDFWTPELTSYYIVGTSYGDVMKELSYVSGGIYPKMYGSSCGSCPTFPCSGLYLTASASPTSGVAPLPVSFTASASGGTAPYTYSWAFGDGGTSTSQSPSHQYTSAGTYTATLTVHDAVNATATKSFTINVTASAGLSAACSTASPTSGSAPLTVQFTGCASGGTTPYTYTWAFGDGGTSTSQSPSHQYTSAGTYTATLTVRDAVNATATKSFTINVTTPAALSATCSSASPTSGSAPLTVQFTGCASGGTTPYAYSWAFGDTSTSTLQSPSHQYTSAGTYTATLTVRDAVNTTATKNFTTQVSTGGAYTISGKVSNGSSAMAIVLPGLPGVTMTLSGAGSGSTTTASNGTYSFSGLANGTYTVTPSLSGYTFYPVSQSVTINNANQTSINFAGS